MGVWTFSPLPLALSAVALMLYTRGFRRLRARRSDLAPWHSAAAFAAGTAIALLAVVSPLDELGENRLLTAHMGQHLLLGDIAPLLLIVGLRGPLAFFVLPPSLLGPLARCRPFRRALSFVLRPWVSLGVWVLVMYGWHVPAAYDAAIAHPLLHDSEHALFFLVGCLVWFQIIDPTGGHMSPGRRALFASGVLLAGMPLAEVLLVAGPIYPHYAAIVNRPFGWTASYDQMHAALLMTAEQIATLLTAAGLLMWQGFEPAAAESPTG